MRNPYKTILQNEGLPYKTLLGTSSTKTVKGEKLGFLTAIALGLILCIGLLAYFDVLVK